MKKIVQTAGRNAPNEWSSHLAIEVPGEETSSEWCETVTDEIYEKLK